eukprot:232696_1
MSATTSVFERIDDALHRYYQSLGESNYIIDGTGKFLAFCDEEGFDVEDIDAELENVDNCGYLDFDDSFPFPPEFKGDDSSSKQQFMFDLLKKCHANPNITFESKLEPNNQSFKPQHDISDHKYPETDDAKANKFLYLMDLNDITDKMQKEALMDCKKYAKNMITKVPSKNKDLCLLVAFGMFYNVPILRFIADSFDVWRIQNNESDRVLTTMIKGNKRFAQYMHQLDKINANHPKMSTFRGNFSKKIVMAVACEQRIAKPILLHPGFRIHDKQIDYIHYVQCIDDFIRKCRKPDCKLTKWHLDIMIIPKKVTDEKGIECKPIIFKSIDYILKNANIKFVKDVCPESQISEFKFNEKCIEFCKRTIMIIDRKKDAIYYYQPSGMAGTMSEVSGTYLPESNLSNSKEILLPKSIGNDKIHAFSKDPNMFVLSYHMFSRNSVRVYWAPHGNKTRFYHDCIWKVWPNYFASESKISSSEERAIKTDWAMDTRQVCGGQIYADNDFDAFYKHNIL